VGRLTKSTDTRDSLVPPCSAQSVRGETPLQVALQLGLTNPRRGPPRNRRKSFSGNGLHQEKTLVILEIISSLGLTFADIIYIMGA